MKNDWASVPIEDKCQYCGETDYLRHNGAGYWNGILVESVFCTYCNLGGLGREDTNDIDPEWHLYEEK